ASTPCIYDPPDQPAQLITTSRTEGMTAYDPLNGQRLWQIPGIFQWRVIASPIVAGNLIIGNCGEASSGKLLVAVRPQVVGQRSEVVWRMVAQAPYVPTPLAKGDLLFTLSDTGVLSCLRSATGQVLWQQHLGGSYYSSPVCVNDRIYCISKKGEVVVVAASPQFQLLARNQLGELCYSTPAISGGRLYIRTLTHLICLGGR
ncbi:MAG: PQQ-binding-like beta-propeller repeat protein, partial [Bacillota bacterium]